MKSKLTLIAVLALGILTMAAPGTGLAASGSAGSAQYAPEEESHFCEENGGTEGAGGGCEYPCVEESGAAGETKESSPGQPCEHQEAQAEQSESPAPAPAPAESGTGGGSLPYTGFPVVPALLVGIGLLGFGVLMRMRLRADNLA